MTHFSALFFAFLLCFAMPAAAEEGAAAAGRKIFVGDQEITMPVIEGFKEVYGTNEAFDGHVRQFVPADNRLLAVYLSDADAAAVLADPTAPLAKYMLVQATKSGMAIKSPEDFNAIRAEIIKGTGVSLDKNPAVQEQLDNVSGYIEDQYHKRTKLKVGETKSLGAFMDYEGAFGVAILANVGVETEQGAQDVPIATSVSVLNIKGSALFVNAYANYGGVEDAEFVRVMAKGFTKAAFDANGAGELKEAATPAPEEVQPLPMPPPLQDDKSAGSSFINVALGVTGLICLGILAFFLLPLFRKLGGGNKDESV